MSQRPHYHGHRERLRERLKREPSQLADYEILELLLGYVIRRGDTKPMAKAILEEFGTLRNAFQARPEELKKIEGFGPATEVFWLLWRETWARLHESSVRERAVLSSPDAVIRFARARLGIQATEEFWIALVDNKNRLMEWERVSQGTVSQAPVYPREVLAKALLHKASGIILVHNHPGGDPKPSSQDVNLTRRIVRAASDLDLRVLDHLIVTDTTHYSFQENGML
jgi:DNA repair protein RadC